MYKSIENFEIILENVSDGIIVADPGTKKFLIVNKKICSMLGYSKEELLELSLENIHPKNEMQFVIQQFNKIVESDDVPVFRINLLHKSGKIITTELNSSKIIINGQMHVTGIFRDITDKLQLENELKSINEKLESKILERTIELGRIIEELQASNEELKSTTEELNSTNEELTNAREELNVLNKKLEVKVFEQTQKLRISNENLNKMNEELQASNEELQVANEEIIATNEMLNKKNSELNEIKQRFETIFNNSPVGILLTDPINKQHVLANIEFCNMTGYDKDEIKKLKLTDIHPVELTDFLNKAFEDFIKNEFVPPKHFEVPIIKKDGAIILTELRPAKIFIDNHLFIIGSFKDITEQKKAEDESKKRLEFLQTLMDAIPNPVFYKNKNGLYLGCNKAFEELFGFKKNEVIGKTVFEIAPKEIADKYFKADNDLFANPDKIQVYEWLVQKKNGEKKNVIFSKSAFYDSSNNLAGLIGVILDITKIKTMEHQLVNSAKLSAVGQLASGIAHEFNNILAIIRGNVQLTLENKNFDDTQGIIETLKVIEKQSARGADIVSNMISFAKPIPPKLAYCNILEIIEDVIKLNSKQLSFDKIDIELNYSEIPELYIDKNQFQQVFLNLIINARHAIIPKKQGKISITAYCKNNFVEIKISDNGIGMTDEIKNKLFMPFFTTKGALAKNNYNINGTGLGLSITYSIITKHNCKIFVESEPDKGSEFTIQIPVFTKIKTSNDAETDEMANNKIKLNKNLKLLIVDDEKEITDLLSRFLKKSGLKNIFVQNSSLEALTLVKKEKFDVVMLDLYMPEITGEEFAEQLRKIDPKIPLIIMSGQITDIPESIHKYGIHTYFEKPFNLPSLIQNLSKIIPD
ncbi:PAS domain S-box protein [Candidatus Dependentiae bacterium]|nr:PAS domain S-box protein [Candidatus Dependentiae bacterium]